MFSGIVEGQAECFFEIPSDPSAKDHRNDPFRNLKLSISRPAGWTDIALGDSIAINGVCLTVETLGAGHLEFSVGPETLKVTGWLEKDQQPHQVNIERSVKFGDRVHGHLVAGHVDEMGKVVSAEASVHAAGHAPEEWLVLWIHCSRNFSRLVWRKGSVAINGVSLTVNDTRDWSSDLERAFQVTLIPETLRRTNLAQLHAGDRVCLEADSMARSIVAAVEAQTLQRGAQ
jgi:riboflavin synthase